LPEQYRFPIPENAYAPEKTPTCPTGMRGRMAVFEILEMTSQIEQIVLENPVDSKLWASARATQGMLTMREDAIIKAFGKQVPFSEVNALSGVMASEGDETQALAQVSPVVQE
jgi:type IV pilus assembly protein PilB